MRNNGLVGYCCFSARIAFTFQVQVGYGQGQTMNPSQFSQWQTPDGTANPKPSALNLCSAL